MVNGSIPIGESSEVYFNAAYVYRKTLSNAKFRQPYWRVNHVLLHTPDGSQPDYTLTPDNNGDPGSSIYNEITIDQAAGNYKGYNGYQPFLMVI